jgi:hypothetical protein
MTYEKWKAYYDLAGKHPVAADLEHNVLFALGDWIADHIALEGRVRELREVLEYIQDHTITYDFEKRIAAALLSSASSAEPRGSAEAGR